MGLDSMFHGKQRFLANELVAGNFNFGTDIATDIDTLPKKDCYLE